MSRKWKTQNRKKMREEKKEAEKGEKLQAEKGEEAERNERGKNNGQPRKNGEAEKAEQAEKGDEVWKNAERVERGDEPGKKREFFKSQYHSSYCEALVRHGGVGRNLTQFAAKLGVNRSTLYEWANNYPEFREAMKIAKTKMEAKWWDRADSQMDSKFNFGIWKFVMENAFGYNKDDVEKETEKPEKKHYVVTIPDVKPLNMNPEDSEIKDDAGGKGNGNNLDAAADPADIT